MFLISWAESTPYNSVGMLRALLPRDSLRNPLVTRDSLKYPFRSRSSMRPGNPTITQTQSFAWQIILHRIVTERGTGEGGNASSHTRAQGSNEQTYIRAN